MKKTRRGLALLLALVLSLSFATFAPIASAAPSDGELTYMLTENFETNLSYEWPWTLSPGAWEIRADENDRMWTNNRINQSLANGTGDNTSRTATYTASGTGARAARLHLIDPIKSDYRINVKFDWYPSTINAANNGGILGFKDSSTQDGSIEEFWTKYITFAVQPTGIYYKIGSLTSDTVENTSPPIQGTNNEMKADKPGVTLINSAFNQWYTVNVDINFRNNTLDLLVTSLDGLTTYTSVVDAPFLADGETADGTFRSFSFMGNYTSGNWTTRIDNVVLSAYSACPKPVISDITGANPRTGSFGMNIGAYAPMFPAANVSFNVYATNNATGVEVLAGTANAVGAGTFTVPRGNAEYSVTAEAIVDGVVSGRSAPLTLSMNEAGLTAPAALVTSATIIPSNGSYALSWAAATGDDPAVDSYMVYRAWYENGPYELIATVAGTSYTDTNIRLSSNLRTYYKFVSMSPGGISGMSAAFYPTSIDAPIVTPGKDRALSAVYLGGDKGAEINVSATGPDGQELTSGVYLSWRWYGADEALNTTFSVYRKDTGDWNLLASGLTLTNMVDPAGNQYSLYKVVGTGDAAQNLVVRDTVVWEDFFLKLQVYKPAAQFMTLGSAAGEYANYEANDSLLGDLDGDGTMDLVIKWAPTNAQDSSRTNLETGTTFYDGYKVNWQTGETQLLWRVNLGRGVRSGAHYSQFGVEDFAGLGYAQVIVLGAQGTTAYKSLDGTDKTLVKTGHVIDENHASVPINGPGGITQIVAIDGKTGEIIDHTAHIKNTKSGSNDNAKSRENAIVAWIDGHDQAPVFVTGSQYSMAETSSGYHGRPIAYRLKDGKLTAQQGTGEVGSGNGNHQMMGVDINGDGKDEILMGGAIYNSDLTFRMGSANHKWTNGTNFYPTIAHGDAMHIGNWVPDDVMADLLGITVEAFKAQTNGKPRLYSLQVIEGGSQAIHLFVRDLLTGTIVAGYQANGDMGRGLAIDAFPTYRGAEFWGSKVAHDSFGNWDTRVAGSYAMEFPGIELGRPITAAVTRYGNLTKIAELSGSMNFSIFWDGDLLKEMQDHTFLEAGGYRPISTNITKMDWVHGKEITLFETTEAFTINGTKGNPNYQGDFLGDWREETILRDAFDQNFMRVYQSTIQSDYVLPWLYEDQLYKSSTLAQETVYNQPSNPGFLPSLDVITARDVAQVVANTDAVEISYTPANDGFYGNGAVRHQLWRRTGESNLDAIDLTPKGTLSNTMSLALKAIGYAPIVTVSGTQNLIDTTAEPSTQYSYIVMGVAQNGQLSYVPDSALTITTPALVIKPEILSVDFNGFTNLVNKNAAKVPVTVTAVNPDSADIYVGLFVDDVLVASAKTVDGAAVLNVAAFNTSSDAVVLKAWFADADPSASASIPVKQLPANIWAPEVNASSPAGKTEVLFAEAISLTSTAAVTIDGAAAAGFAADGTKLTITGEAEEGDIIVMKGVKYPALYPSYSFTFTIICPEMSPPPSAPYEDFEESPYLVTGANGGSAIGNNGANMTYGVEDGAIVVTTGANSVTGARAARLNFSTVSAGAEGIVNVTFDWNSTNPTTNLNSGLLIFEDADNARMFTLIANNGQLLYSTENITTYSAVPAGTLITSGLGVWYTVSVTFNFTAKKIDLTITDRANPANITTVAGIDFAGSAASNLKSLLLIGTRAGSNNLTWSSSFDNFFFSNK